MNTGNTNLPSFALTGFFNGRRCVAFVEEHKRGYICEIHDAERLSAYDSSMGNPAFYPTQLEAINAVRKVFRA